ncbi:MAG: hypothetical protein ACUVRD_05860 [Bacteroidia bacterium]
MWRVGTFISILNFLLAQSSTVKYYYDSVLIQARQVAGCTIDPDKGVGVFYKYPIFTGNSQRATELNRFIFSLFEKYGYQKRPPAAIHRYDLKKLAEDEFEEMQKHLRMRCEYQSYRDFHDGPAVYYEFVTYRVDVKEYFEGIKTFKFYAERQSLNYEAPKFHILNWIEGDTFDLQDVFADELSLQKVILLTLRKATLDNPRALERLVWIEPSGVSLPKNFYIRKDALCLRYRPDEIVAVKVQEYAIEFRELQLDKEEVEVPLSEVLPYMKRGFQEIFGKK